MRSSELIQADFAADGSGLESALVFGLRLVGAVESFAASFGLGDLGDIELPPEVGSTADQAALRAAASLYLASELEAAGLLPAAELLAGLFAGGGLSLAPGSAANRLAVFWQGRHERFSPTERRAFFVRLFGAEFGAGLAGDTGTNPAFGTLMADLTEAIFRWEGHLVWRQPAGAREETRVRLTAYQLAANLVPRSTGMTPFAARDILTTLQQALDILKEPEVQGLFGAASVWMLIQKIYRRYRREPPDSMNHLARAKAGQIVLAWLADVVPRLSGYTMPVLNPGHEVLAASAAWLQASLALEDRRLSAASAP